MDQNGSAFLRIGRGAPMAERERIDPQGPYQECLLHALVMAHLLEHATMFLPKDCELWHSAGVELLQFSSWIKLAIKSEETLLDARRHRRIR